MKEPVMKERFASFLVKNSRIILIISIVLALIFAVLIPFVNVNKDMTKYLPGDSSMRRGLDLMEAEFGKEDQSELKIMFDDLRTDKEKIAMKKDLLTLPNADSVDYALPEAENGDDYNRGKHTLYIVNCKYGQYSDQATRLWNEANDRYGEDHEISLGGTIDTANHSGLPVWIAASAVILVFIVLLVMANSWIEPAAFLITIGIAVMINMGSYIFFPSISKTTFGIVAVLQLALSMDYSIMLLNRYRQQRQAISDKREAMRQALSLSFGAITGSSLTTFAGLLALLFMRFGIGSDIGLALAKGVLISLICIFTALPALLLAFDSLMLRMAKPTIPFDLPCFSAFQFRARLPLTLLFFCLFFAGFIARSGVDFSYADYGSGEEIDKVFGRDNTIVMVYNEEDRTAAGKLAETLDDRDPINSAICYESTIGKSRTAGNMKTFIDDMSDSDSNDFASGSDLDDTAPDSSDLSLSTLRLIYYDRFAGDPRFRLSLPAFVSFLRHDVMEDPDFGKTLDEKTRSRINDMEKFTNVRALTSKKNASGLAAFFGMSRSQASQLLLYYQIRCGRANPGKMTLPAFVSFLINDLANDPDYGSMISRSQLKKLRSMQVYTKWKKMTKERTYRGAANLLSMKEEQMRLVYVYHHSADGIESARTISDLALILTLMAEDPALKSQFGGEDIARLIEALLQIGEMDPTPYQISDMVSALENYGVPLDEATLTLIYAYGDIAEDPSSHKMSVQELVRYMLSDKVIRGSLSKKERKQLKMLRRIIDVSVSGKRLSPASLGRILGMRSRDVRSVYLLRQYKTGRTGGWKLTPQEFIHFLTDHVLSDPAMKGRIGGKAKDLRLARKIIDGSVSGKKYSFRELSDLLGGYSDEMSPDDLALLYELYGSRYRYDKSWRMDLRGLVAHLDDEMTSRPAFADSMDEDQLEDIHEMREDLDEAAGKLEGERYGRMMISADLEEDSDETRAFLDRLTEYTDSQFERPVYLIGTTPMAYETSQTFQRELNRLTILTALFILIIILLTFRQLAAPVILVLIIQCAVFLTMAALNLMQIDMNYLALLIVQSIMMGATIDYAIIYSTYYIEHRTSLSRQDAIRASFRGSLQTILTSATVLIAAVGLLSFAFSEPATRQICRILSAGCLIATILVIFLLPGILACLDRLVIKKGAEDRGA